MPAGHIIVKHEDLHPRVREQVVDVFESRRQRAARGLTGASIGLGATQLSMIYELTHNNASIRSVLGFGVLLPTGWASAYKSKSGSVRRETEMLGNAIEKAGRVDEAGKHELAALRETHPFYFVNRKGDLVFVPKTKFQNAIVKAQGTFLREVLPARWRGKL